MELKEVMKKVNYTYIRFEQHISIICYVSYWERIFSIPQNTLNYNSELMEFVYAGQHAKGECKVFSKPTPTGFKFTVKLDREM